MYTTMEALNQETILPGSAG